MDRLCCFNGACSQFGGVNSSCGTGKGRSFQSPIKYGFNLVKGKSNHPMEDFHVANFVRTRGHELGLFAIYDGHSGDSVPAYLQKHLFHNILKEDEFWKDPKSSITKAYERTDQEILSHSPDLGRGGSTAVTAILINGQKLLIANVGDSRAVLSRSMQAIQMSTDHEPSTERGTIERKGGFVSNMPVGQDIRDRFSGAVEAFARRNNSGSGVHGDHSRHKNPEDSPKEMVPDSEKNRTSSRNGSTSKRAIASSSRPTSSGEPASEGRSSRLVSGSNRLSTTQRIQPGLESKSTSLSRSTGARGNRDDPLRSFELLSIGTDKRK